MLTRGLAQQRITKLCKLRVIKRLDENCDIGRIIPKHIRIVASKGRSLPSDTVLWIVGNERVIMPAGIKTLTADNWLEVNPASELFVKISNRDGSKKTKPGSGLRFSDIRWRRVFGLYPGNA